MIIVPEGYVSLQRLFRYFEEKYWLDACVYWLATENPDDPSETPFDVLKLWLWHSFPNDWRLIGPHGASYLFPVDYFEEYTFDVSEYWEVCGGRDANRSESKTVEETLGCGSAYSGRLTAALPHLRRARTEIGDFSLYSLPQLITLLMCYVEREMTLLASWGGLQVETYASPFFKTQIGQIDLMRAKSLSEDPECANHFTGNLEAATKALAPYEGYNLCISQKAFERFDNSKRDEFLLIEVAVNTFRTSELDNTPAPRRIGAPRKREDAALAYLELFPEGHEARGVMQARAAEMVSSTIGKSVSFKTIKRGVEEYRKKTGTK